MIAFLSEDVIQSILCVEGCAVGMFSTRCRKAFCCGGADEDAGYLLSAAVLADSSAGDSPPRDTAFEQNPRWFCAAVLHLQMRFLSWWAAYVLSVIVGSIATLLRCGKF